MFRRGENEETWVISFACRQCVYTYIKTKSAVATWPFHLYFLWFVFSQEEFRVYAENLLEELLIIYFEKMPNDIFDFIFSKEELLNTSDSLQKEDLMTIDV